ncbi:AmmeMemoRadiSam system protein A [Desulfofalx alkaliphila]|uniref:AmmeMemoRadiSam system protein A n=1 Tax=Desulfofalx alkaliphila TaxID=105483 RepID=UPI0004E0B414|nr:AmmeMemoRadiSam system protein A [Desulfofalx alkaliphila]
MSVVFCGVVPHPPIAVPEVGNREAKKVQDTQQALLELGWRIKASGAEVLVIISPHSPVFADAIVINNSPRLKGSLQRFGAPGVTFDYAGDLDMVDEIIDRCQELNLAAAVLDEDLAKDYNVDVTLDHGVTVPLYFIRQAGVELPLVVVSMSLLSFEQLYHFGLAVDRAARAQNRPVALLASGDLSHRLAPDAPAGFHPQAKEFDSDIVRLVGAADAQGLINYDLDAVDRAGECGMRPIIMMMGALDGKGVEAEVLSYQAPFGVGYMVASLIPGRQDDSKSILANLAKERQQRIKKMRERESYLVQLARHTLESHVLGKDKPKIDLKEVPEEFKKPAATFVTVKKNGHLRGCIGTVLPRYESIVEEVMQNAISAGTADPRFQPVRPEELDELTYSVDVLAEPEPISDLTELDPHKYGVIVSAGHRRGLLLPNLEGIDHARQQVEIAKEKAGIGPGEKVNLERFEVIRYK